MIKIDDIDIYIMVSNRHQYLKMAIDSILDQTLKPNIITIFDNSIDNTEIKNIVSNYENKGVTYLKNLNQSSNYATVKNSLKHKYCLLFHDDILNKYYLEMVVNLLNKHKKISFIASRCLPFYNDNEIDTNTKLTNKYYLFKKQNLFAKHLYFLEHLCISSCIFNTDFLKKTDYQFEKYGKLFDWPYLVRLAAHGNSIIIDDDKACLARMHENQWSHEKKSTVTFDNILNWHKCFEDGMKAHSIFSIDHYYYINRCIPFVTDMFFGTFPDKEKNEENLQMIKKAIKEKGINTKQYKNITKKLLKRSFLEDLKNSYIHTLRDN